MSRTSTLTLLGILVILTPFSGLPMSFRSLLAVVFGACVSGIGLSLRAQDARNQRQSVEASLPPVAPLTVSEPASPSGVSPI